MSNRHASVSSNYPGQSVGPSITLSDFHSVSVSETSHSVNRQDDIAVADMVADIELDMVVDLRVF